MRAYIAATEEGNVQLDWDAAERVAQAGSGVPEAISATRRAAPIAEIAAAGADPGN